MHITVNGHDRNVASPLTVAELLEMLGINPKTVVVERNLKIIDRKEFNLEALEDGDQIEIIRLVGGG
jgi:thiamine biosynthesis protein ThiS